MAASKFCVLFLVCSVYSLPQPDFSSSPPQTSYGAAPPQQPSYNSGGSGGMPYDFSYSVNDAYSNSNYGQSEQSDGKSVQGYYTVDLPDGRKQTVKYTADHSGGFVAYVSYEGEAQYAKAAPPVTFFKGGKGNSGGGGGYGSGGSTAGKGGNSGYMMPGGSW